MLCFKREQIIACGIAYSDKFLPDALNSPSMDITSCVSVLTEAKRLGILSDSTHRSIVSLQKEESENFKSKPDITECETKDDVQHAGAPPSKSIYPGQLLQEEPCPVLVNPQGVLLNIPGIDFTHCPCLMVSAVFKPSISLGGGHSSYL
ncbi:unnamed protein product [Fraxinus pennsylvanica]|uniref:Uncharacterized protein n=1 Tax=Fraxinus pennsylvanica TaxID=56036 RepID=A0AAD2DPI6_9LAMI|nr:unnamed protein product [Fraxinus pennsylvanica]